MIIQFGWDLKINQSVTNVQNKLQEFKKKKKLVEALYFECRFLRHIGMSKSNLQNNDYTVLCVGVTVMCLGKVHIFQHLHTFIGEGGFPGGLSFRDTSVGKESTCHAGVSGSIPGSGRSPGEGIGCPLQYSCLENPMEYSSCGHKESDTTAGLSLPWWPSGRESACRAEDVGSIPGWGRSPGGGHGRPPQSSCLEHPVDRGAWRATVVHGVAKESDMSYRPKIKQQNVSADPDP